MRLAFLLFLLAVLLLVCAGARGQDEDAEPVRARVLCDGARVAAIQIEAPRAGLITIRLPENVCGRSA
jgi:hypothetical protein